MEEPRIIQLNKSLRLDTTLLISIRYFLSFSYGFEWSKRSIAVRNVGRSYVHVYMIVSEYPRNVMASSTTYSICTSGVHRRAAKCHSGSRSYFWTRISPCSMAKLASSLFAHSSQALAISSKSFSVPRPNFSAFSRNDPPLS